jgi:hypothetical protein
MPPFSTPLGYLSDNETKVDYLNNEAIASTVLRLVKANTDQPITVGVHGDWGAGKSSILEMVEAALKDDKRTICLKFNGWQFQGFEDAKIALIEGVLNGLTENQSVLTKAGDAITRAWRCLNKLKLLTGIFKLVLAAKTGIPTHVSGVADLATAYEHSAVEMATDADSRAKVAEDFKGLVNDGATFERPSAPHEIAGFRKAFKEVVDKADIDRLVVLVDDLDRCLPETAIQTLEAIRLFVLMEKTAFVVGADERMIEYAVHRHFPNLPQREDSQGYARAYLEKLLQVPFRIPALGETETKIYVTLLLLGAVIDDKDRFDKLLVLGQQALRSPWDPGVLNDAAIREVLAEVSVDESAAIVMAERISPVLASGTKGNPRQIKRFLNALTLRLAVSSARGFGSAIDPGRLAKLMLAELFLPDSVFMHIASSAANANDGVCTELADIENFAKAGSPAPVGGTNTEGSDESEENDGEAYDSPEPTDASSTALLDWRLRPEVVKWAAVEPDLQGVNLKPYLFVIKDKKNYLSSSAPLSPKLRDLVAKLTGGDLNAVNVRPVLKGLTASEVDAVFTAIRGQVLASPSFDRKPPALAGISILVQEFPALGGRYVDLLGDLPAGKLNSWAASGHGFVTEAFRERLEKQMDKWAASGNTRLKKGIGVVRRSARPPAKGG